MAEPSYTQPDEAEIRGYYKFKGLPSPPRLVARTSITPWKDDGCAGVPTIGAYNHHRIIPIWNEQGLLEAVVKFIQSTGIQWTSVDVVRFGIKTSSGTMLEYDSEPEEQLKANDSQAATILAMDLWSYG